MEEIGAINERLQPGYLMVLADIAACLSVLSLVQLAPNVGEDGILEHGDVGGGDEGY